MNNINIVIYFGKNKNHPLFVFRTLIEYDGYLTSHKYIFYQHINIHEKYYAVFHRCWTYSIIIKSEVHLFLCFYIFFYIPLNVLSTGLFILNSFLIYRSLKMWSKNIKFVLSHSQRTIRISRLKPEKMCKKRKQSW